jgi:alkylation response protein AidB-like acyl-CoA dehydrogenase
MNGNAVDTLLVMEAFGRGLVLEPYLSAVIVAGGLIRDAGSAAQKEDLLPAIAGGERMLALAHYERDARYEVSRVDTAAKADGSGWKLSGAKGVVLGGGSADTLIVSANTGKGPSLFLVDSKAAGIAVRNYATQDGARAAEIALNNVAVGADALVGPEGGALPIIERALDYGIAALCAEAVGIMAALDEATLEYLKTRKQFGQPIGRFQALQHRMVDMVIATEQSRSMAMMAAVKADSPDAAERRRAISAAKAYIGQQARFVGQQAVQLHGGMGVVDELNVSHYFKRLTLIELTFGNTDHHLGLFSDTLLTA